MRGGEGKSKNGDNGEKVGENESETGSERKGQEWKRVRMEEGDIISICGFTA